MKKRNTKKGFTLVELVIVIAVIAILAGVLIPTFSNVVAKAQASARLQEATNYLKEDFALAMSDDGAITAADKTTHGLKGTFTGDATKYTYTVDVDDKTLSYSSETRKWTETAKQ